VNSQNPRLRHPTETQEKPKKTQEKPTETRETPPPPPNSRFQRLVRSWEYADEKRRREMSLSALFNEMPPEMRTRYAQGGLMSVSLVDTPVCPRPVTACRAIRENYKRLSSTSQMFVEQMESKLDGLAQSYLRLLNAAFHHREYLNTTNPESIRHEARELEKGLEKQPPKVQEINRKRIEILNQRVEKHGKVRENCQVIDAQCAAVEDVLQLIRDQSVTMRDPRQLSDHLDTLVRDVEQTEETVREVEAIFESMPPLPPATAFGVDMAATVSNPLEAFPAWARELSEKYYSRTISMFVLHGNVRDLVAWKRPALTEFPPLQRFLKETLFGQRDLVISYDRGGGLSFATPDMKADFDRAMAGYDSFHGTTLARGLPRNPDSVLSLLDNYLRLRILDRKKIALIVDFAETIVPAEDRNSPVILKRWAQNSAFLQADVTFCLIAENLIELNLGLVQNPGVASIQIPLPDETERLDVIAAQPAPTNSDVTPAALAKLTAGLKRVQLLSLIADSAESGGLLEFVPSRFDLSMVAGQAAAKRKLLDRSSRL